MWKQEIEHGLAKEDDHQADSHRRSVEVLFSVDHVYRFQSNQWIEQPSNTDPYENNAWYYNPIVDITHPDHRAEMYAVKLHPNSEYVFRLEILKDQAKMMDKKKQEKCICSLAECSKDASFPGYPYGLIDADRFARVSGIEVCGHNLQFLSFAGSSGVLKRLKKCLKTSDAHELLNKI